MSNPWNMALRRCGSRNPSSVSQCGCAWPAINCLGLLPTSSRALLGRNVLVQDELQHTEVLTFELTT